VIVVDASTVVDALVGASPAPDLLTALAAEFLHAPTLLDYEVGSALRGHVRAARLTEPSLATAGEMFAMLRSPSTTPPMLCSRRHWRHHSSPVTGN
jgi:predicted nucleic acid-binding protein